MCDATKTEESARTISIPTELTDVLSAQRKHVQERTLKWGYGYQREPMLLFAGPAGAPRSPTSVTRLMRRVMGTVDVTGVQPTHGWRHTAATLLLDSGQNIKTIATRLGHSTPAITQALYVHQWPSAMSNRRGISAAS